MVGVDCDDSVREEIRGRHVMERSDSVSGYSNYGNEWINCVFSTPCLYNSWIQF